MRSLTLGELAELTGSELVGNPSHRILGVADLTSATPEQVSFLGRHPYGQKNPAYEKAMLSSQAGAIFICPDVERPEGRNYLLSNEPTLAFQQALEFFLVDQGAAASGWSGIHPSAIIHPTARLGERVTVGPLAVIEKEVVIGDDATIGAHCTIGVGVTIGQGTFLHANVVIRERCQIGSRVILQPGVVIGSCGFGYRLDEKGHHQKLQQVGIVVIGDDTEIGANTTVDRARFGKTVIGKGVKIDNLCQIGHGVTIGDHSIMAAFSAIAGSAKVGSHVVMAGQVGINSHITIANGTILAARTAVAKSIDKAGRFCGAPAEPLGRHLKNLVAASKLADHMSEFRKFKQQVSKLLDISEEPN